MPDWVAFILDKIVLAILVGVFTSAIFLLILSRFRPKIDISPKIACGTNTRGATVYRIKVINRSRVPLTDIKAQFHICETSQTATGAIRNTNPIRITQPEPMES